MESTTAVIYNSGRLPDSIVPLDKLLSFVPSELQTKIKQKYPDLLKGTLREMRTSVLTEYLCWRLDLTPELTQKLLRTYSVINHSVGSLLQTWKCLTTDIQFEPEKIKVNFFLLQIQPKRIQAFLAKVPSLGSIQTTNLIHKWPRILSSAPENILKTYKYLKDHRVSDDQISRYACVFALAPETVRKRLEEISAIPEFNLLNGCNNFLRLVYNQDMALTRLHYLRSVGFTTVSLHLLTTSNDRFQQLLRSENPRVSGSEVISYLSDTLKFSPGEIYTVLQRHPKWNQATVVNASDVLNVLRQRGYSRQHILNGLPLVLYPKGSILSIVKNLPNTPEAQPYEEWSQHYNVLQLVLYLLERENNFSGDGIFVQT